MTECLSKRRCVLAISPTKSSLVHRSLLQVTNLSCSSSQARNNNTSGEQLKGPSQNREQAPRAYEQNPTPSCLIPVLEGSGPNAYRTDAGRILATRAHTNRNARACPAWRHAECNLAGRTKIEL